MFPSKKMWIDQHFELSWKSTEIEIKLLRNIKLIQFSLFFQLIKQKKKEKTSVFAQLNVAICLVEVVVVVATLS